MTATPFISDLIQRRFVPIPGCLAVVLQSPAYFTRHHTPGAAWESTRRIFDSLSTSLTFLATAKTVHDLPKGAWRLALLLEIYAS